MTDLPKTYTVKVFTKEEIEELKELAKPLVKYLNRKHDPHTVIDITYDGIALSSQRVTISIDDYIG